MHTLSHPRASTLMIQSFGVVFGKLAAGGATAARWQPLHVAARGVGCSSARQHLIAAQAPQRATYTRLGCCAPPQNPRFVWLPWWAERKECSRMVLGAQKPRALGSREITPAPAAAAERAPLLR